MSTARRRSTRRGGRSPWREASSQRGSRTLRSASCSPATRAPRLDRTSRLRTTGPRASALRMTRRGTVKRRSVAAGQTNPFPSKPPAKNIDFGNSGFLPFGGGGVYFVNPNLKTPYVFQYNLSIQREVMKNMMAEASYIGSSRSEVTGLVDSNPFILGTTTRLFNAPPGVPGNFSYLETFDNVGKAHYNSLALSLTRRTSEVKGLGSLMYQVSYTYGKSIDNSSGFRARNSNVPY